MAGMTSRTRSQTSNQISSDQIFADNQADLLFDANVNHANQRVDDVHTSVEYDSAENASMYSEFQASIEVQQRYEKQLTLYNRYEKQFPRRFMRNYDRMHIFSSVAAAELLKKLIIKIQNKKFDVYLSDKKYDKYRYYMIQMKKQFVLNNVKYREDMNEKKIIYSMIFLIEISKSL